MPRIAFISPLGGSGRTTTTAHMLTELVARGHAAIGIDLCPQNQLGRYLGLQQPAMQGWATSVLDEQWWAVQALENSVGVGFLPFGQPQPAELQQLNQQLSRESGWLDWHLGQLDVPDTALLLLDTPAWPAPLAQQAVSCADVVMVTLDASLRACQALDLIQCMLSSVPSPQTSVGLILTGFDARRPSHRDALHTLRGQWGQLLLPYLVHADESLTQAHAQAMCVTQHAPHAQSASDMQGVATWLEFQCEMVPYAPFMSP